MYAIRSYYGLKDLSQIFVVSFLRQGRRNCVYKLFDIFKFIALSETGNKRHQLTGIGNIAVIFKNKI